MQKKTMADLQPEWARVLEKGYSNYEALSKAERTWFNIGVLVHAVTNGGVIGFYCNSGAEYYKETIEDLNGLGFQDLSAAIMKANSFFPNSDPPFDGNERNKIIESWPENAYEEELDELDKIFMNRHLELESKLLDFVLASNITAKLFN